MKKRTVIVDNKEYTWKVIPIDDFVRLMVFDTETNKVVINTILGGAVSVTTSFVVEQIKERFYRKRA